MKRRLEITDLAHEDLRAIWAYFRDKNPAKGKAVMAAIRAAGKRLRTFPETGRAGRVDGTRELVVVGAQYKYVIGYEVHDDKIQVLRILHHAQEWPKKL